MKALAVIINIFFPGIGTLIIGKVGLGIGQFVLYIVGVLLSITGVFSIIGIPLALGVWIWAIVTAASSPASPVEVIIKKETSDK